MENEFKCLENEDHNRFALGLETTTLLGWFPEFNMYGTPLNFDPNTITTHYTCLECDITYLRKYKHGEVTKFIKEEDIGK